MSQKVFDEAGYNMSASAKNTVLELDIPGGPSIQAVEKMLEEIGYCLSPTIRDEILGNLRPITTEKPEPTEKRSITEPDPLGKEVFEETREEDTDGEEDGVE